MKTLFLTFKWWILGAVLALVVGAFTWYTVHERNVGGGKIQVKWDVATAEQNKAAVGASEAARSTEATQRSAYADINTKYLQDTSREYPSIADSIPPAIAGGTIRLRDRCPEVRGSGMPSSTAGARAADAAATAALAQRTANSIAAVRVGERSDAREAQQRAQIVALQAVLRAERRASSP